MNFQDFSNYEIELYEFHDFRDSGVYFFIFLFCGFHDSGIELYEFHDFLNSGVELKEFHNFHNSFMEF